MQIRTTITTTFNCSLERAFKTPMLCDLAKIHTGYGFMPRVTHCLDDEYWGQVGGSRKVVMSKNFFFKGGEAAMDTVLERMENKYWKIEIHDFKFWALGLKKFQGQWSTTALTDGRVKVKYSYTLFSGVIGLYPIHWIITKLLWRKYMRQVIENVRILVQRHEPYLYQ